MKRKEKKEIFKSRKHVFLYHFFISVKMKGQTPYNIQLRAKCLLFYMTTSWERLI